MGMEESEIEERMKMARVEKMRNARNGRAKDCYQDRKRRTR